MDQNKLKGKLLEKQLTYGDCANLLNLSITTFSNKVNGNSNFSVPEANKLANLLKLTDREKIDIFFGNVLA